jgi:hypothetical protein
MSIHDLVTSIRQANADAQAAYDTARTDMLTRHTAEAQALSDKHSAEAAALDEKHTAQIAYLGNLVAVPVPPGVDEE